MSPSAPTKQVALFLGGAAVPAAPTKQTVHPQNKLIRGHGILPCPLCVCYPSHERIHRRVWHPAIPTPPSEVLPQISQKFTDFSQGVQQSLLHQPSTRAPTSQSSHRTRRTHRSFWWRRASHGWHRCAQMVRLRMVLPQNSRNT